jgi:hypothetical protein
MILQIFVTLAGIIGMAVISHYIWPPSRSREVATDIARRRQARKQQRGDRGGSSDDS